MAVIRLDEKPDKIESALFSSLMDGTVAVSSCQDRSVGPTSDLLASSTWQEVMVIELYIQRELKTSSVRFPFIISTNYPHFLLDSKKFRDKQVILRTDNQ